jgi:hypothetical protein
MLQILLSFVFLTSNLLPLYSLNLQIFLDEKAAIETRHQNCMSATDVAKHLEERDCGHKAETSKLKGQIAELLDEKEQRECQLKETKELLVTSEAEAS